jgi:hypothetical protein
MDKKAYPSGLDNLFQTRFAQLLTNSSNNCFEELTQLRMQSRKISSTRLVKDRIVDISLNEIQIDGKRIQIDQLRTFFISIICRLESLLYNSLLFCEREELDLNLTTIQDNIFNKQIGFYFIDYQGQGQDLSRFKELLIRRLFQPDSYIRQVLVSKAFPDRLEFKPTAIRELYQNRTHFLELLLLAIYLTSGSPIRGEEIVLLQYRNCLTTKNRNIVVDPKSNLIRLATTYYKSFNITRAEKTNIRFLCPRLGDILKTYLLVFIPLYHFLNVSYFDQKQISADLFENKGTRYTSVRLSTVLGRESLAYLGQTLTINPYRHLINYVIKTRIRNDYQTNSIDPIEDIQANHTRGISDFTYSRSNINQVFGTTLSIKARSLHFNYRFFSYFDLNTRPQGLKRRQLASLPVSGAKRPRLGGLDQRSLQVIGKHAF